MLKNNKGYAALEIIGVILLLILILGVGFIVYSRQTRLSVVERAEDGSIRKICITEKSIEVCLEIDKESISAAAELKTTTSVTNHGRSTYKYTYGCEDDSPQIYINDNYQERPGPCLASVSEGTVGPGETKTYNLVIPGSFLKEGENKISTRWSGISSGEILIKRESTSDTEISKQFEFCQSQTTYKVHEIPSYCTNINVVLKEDFDNSCERWRGLIKSIDLTGPCPQSSLGINQVYVPRVQEEEWKSKLQSLSEVELVD